MGLRCGGSRGRRRRRVRRRRPVFEPVVRSLSRFFFRRGGRAFVRASRTCWGRLHVPFATRVDAIALRVFVHGLSLLLSRRQVHHITGGEADTRALHAA